MAHELPPIPGATIPHCPHSIHRWCPPYQCTLSRVKDAKAVTEVVRCKTPCRRRGYNRCRRRVACRVTLIHNYSCFHGFCNDATKLLRLFLCPSLYLYGVSSVHSQGVSPRSGWASRHSKRLFQREGPWFWLEFGELQGCDFYPDWSGALGIYCCARCKG